jgi:hypothetical protein
MDEERAPEPRTRTVAVLSTGARVSVLLGLLLLIGAAYLFWSPLEKPTKDGVPFGCRTAASPPTEQFPKSVCGKLNDRRRLQAEAVLMSALVVGVGGVLAFGTTRSVDVARGVAD